MTNEQELTSGGVATASSDKVNGPAIAATLAAAIGSLALGILVILNEASKSISDSLAFTDDVGPLSGKTTIAVIIYLASWGILHVALKDRDVAWKPWLWAAGVLFALGVLFTFPPFFQLFASE